MGNRCECDKRQQVDVRPLPKAMPAIPEVAVPVQGLPEFVGATPSPGDKTVAGIQPYVGIWHRADDMVLMAEICANGSMIWSFNFKVVVGKGSRFTRVHVKGGNENSSLEMNLNGCLHSATLSTRDSRDCLLWSDGEIWVRGFEPYVGLWCRKVDGQLCAGICPDGRLIWNIDSKEETMLSLNASGALVMKFRKAFHTAALQSSGDKLEETTQKELKWNDGDTWVLRPSQGPSIASHDDINEINGLGVFINGEKGVSTVPEMTNVAT